MNTRKIWLILLVVPILMGFFGLADDPASDELTRIRSDIAGQGLQWTAGETSRSRLPAELRQRGKGLLRTVPTETASIYGRRAKAIAIPDQFDWRNKDGQNWITKIKSQGDCGSCWAFSTAAAIEVMFRIERNQPNLEIDLSEQFMVSCSNSGTCDGGNASSVLPYIRNHGCIPESCFRYRHADVPCEFCSEGENNRYFVKKWSYVTDDYYENEYIAEQLLSSPLIAYFEVYSDFDYYQGGVYEVTAGAHYDALHQVLLVGYNRSDRYWICKNSWGENWGEQGYFKIRWDQVSIGKEVIKTSGTYQLKPALGGE